MYFVYCLLEGWHVESFAIFCDGDQVVLHLADVPENTWVAAEEVECLFPEVACLKLVDFLKRVCEQREIRVESAHVLRREDVDYGGQKVFFHLYI